MNEDKKATIRAIKIMILTPPFLYLCYILLKDDLKRGMIFSIFVWFGWWCVVEWAIPQESREGLCEISGCSNKPIFLCPYCGNHYCEEHSTIKAKGRIVT